MAAEIDIRTIANFSALPESDISSLVQAPTADAIQSFLKSIEKNVAECQQSKSRVLKLDVELETKVRQHESKEKALKNTRDKALADLQKCRSDLQTSENNRLKVEGDLEQARSTTSSEASEVSTLRSRVSSLEASNRDTVALLESKTNAYDKLAQDLSAQHQKTAELRKQVTNLDQTVQASNSSVATAKLREQSLQQEIESLKKHNDWLDNERRIKADEHTAFRKEKNGRISELSRLNEQYISETEALRRSETSLKQRLEDQLNKFEDAVQEAQRLREEKMTEAEQWRADLESASRLAELQRASAETQKERVQELQHSLEELQDEAAEEIGQIRAAAEADHTDKLAAESKIVELETTISQLRAEIDEQRTRPSTPQKAVQANGTSTPVRPSTPLGIFSPASTSRIKGSLTNTQLFAEYKKLEKDLAAEKRTNEELQESMNEMVQELEASKPELDEIRADHSRLQTELVDMSSLVQQASRERDESAQEVRICQGQLQAKSTEIEVLSQQLRDAGSEIRYLLMEQHVRDQGGSLSRDDMEQLQAAADQAMNHDMSNLTETQQVVNKELIAFKNISDLQQQNENQLKTIRNLAGLLESRESKEKEERLFSAEQEVEAARAQIAKLEDEMKTMVTQSKSFVKERDMFRNMLTRKGHLPHNLEAADFSKSLPISAGGQPTQSLDGGAGTDYAKLLRDLQSHFDSFRQESATDSSALRSQINDLSKRNSQLQAESSRVLGQFSAAEQRTQMLQANYDMLKTENAEIQKRSFSAMENATKQELKLQQAAEELIEARGLLDSLRRESANLKAEKDLWKNVEKRLIDDNESLRTERSRVDQMYSSLQTMMNERETVDSENRRRLQTQVESLEAELQSTKRKLNEELEESKRSTMRREYEQEQSQKRIDDLMTSISSTREELASTKTSRDHLQARVDELTVELRSAEERLDVYTKPPHDSSNEELTEQDQSATREQELAIEVSELKRDLELARSELERANEQIEVYKGISQSSEERLQEMTETNDQYREETEAAIAEKDTKVRDLEQRCQDIASELETTNSELSKLRDEQSNVDRRLEDQKANFVADIERLKEQEERASEQAKFNLEASKAQAQIAQEAQQNYETELVKHAEAAKALQIVRSEANQLRLEMVDLKTQAETAQTNLQQKESSWSDMRDRYETELTDIKQRREEAAQQNALLHGQLETLTQQITALQRDRTTVAEGGSSETPGSGLDNLQEVIKYLRREKEIVDVQYHLSTQELKRLRQQFDFTQSQLDETRLKLDQQQRAGADSERNAISHNKLMETMNELNILRESNVTLRSESKQAQQALSERSKQVERLETEIQPLRARVAELEHLVELREGENKLLQDDRDHWQQRTQNILSKYDRVDPAELEAMKEKLSNLEKERDEAIALRDSLQAQVDDTPSQVEAAKTELRTKLAEQFKARSREQNQKIREKQNEVDTISSERDGLRQELDVVREQLESARNHSVPSGDVQMNGDGAPSPGEVTADNNQRVSQLESQVAELESSVSKKDQEIAELQSGQEEGLEDRLEQLKQEAEAAKQAALEDLRQKLATEHQQELEALRRQSVTTTADTAKAVDSEVVNSPNAGTGSDDQPSDEVLRNLDSQKARFVIKENPTVKAILSKNIQNVREKMREEFAAASGNNSGSSGDFEAQKEALISEKEAEFTAEKERLEQDFATRLEKDKQNMAQQHQEELSAQKLELDQAAETRIAQQIATKEAMLQKASDMKYNLVQGRFSQANAKIEVVRKAAEETPDKAVKDVWEVAKNAKPAPVPKPAPTPAASAAPATPATPSAQPAPTAAAATANAQAAESTEVKEETQAPTEESQQQAPPPNTQSALPKPGTASNPGVTRSTSGIAQPINRRVSGIQAGRGSAQQSGIPVPGSQTGTGRGGSGIPRGPGGVGRGRGAGTGRGGANTAAPPPRGAASGSPGRGSLNPSASTFTPGNAGAKRPREESEGDGNAGKRARGGGQGQGA